LLHDIRILRKRKVFVKTDSPSNRHDSQTRLTSTSTRLTLSISLYRGWIVTWAAFLIGLVVGMLYVWSVIKGAMPASWGWDHAQLALPYSVMCGMFALTMIPAGRLQDRRGPRIVILLGGLLTGLGCVVSGLSGSSVTGYVIGFGVLTGAGVGLSYSALTPASIKWFPPQRTGLVAGIVAGGVGAAPVLLAPLATALLDAFATTTRGGVVEKGVPATMVVLGVIAWVVIGSLALLIRNPPEGFDARPPSTVGRPVARPVEFSVGAMLRTAQFWLLFLMFFFAAAAGLTFISIAQDLGKAALGANAFVAVVVLAAGSTTGRVLAGFVSDRIGRQWTLFSVFVFQTVVVAVLYWMSANDSVSLAVLVVVFFLGFNYGSNLSLFPAACKDYFGLRNFGLNYGCLFFAFGLAGLVMPYANGAIRDATGSYTLSYVILIGLMILAAGMSQISRILGQPGVARVTRAGQTVGEGAD
jgi:MFS transporter, OFA family, oxalate/formate antiporter